MNQRIRKVVTQIPGWLSEKEGQFLEDTAKRTERLPGVVVEIGSFLGKSTVWLAQGTGIVYAIDPHNGNVSKSLQFQSTYQEFKKNLLKANVSSKVIIIRKMSKEAEKSWKQPIRMLFIDALHDEKSSTQDFKLFEKYVVKGGIIVMHDSFLRWCGSEKVALKNIIHSNKFSNIGFTGSILYGTKQSQSNFLAKDTIMRLVITLSIKLNHLFIITKVFSVSIFQRIISLKRIASFGVLNIFLVDEVSACSMLGML